MRKFILASSLKDNAVSKLNELGYEIINFSDNPNLDKRIAHHADLSFFVSDKDIFIAREMAYLKDELEAIGCDVFVEASVTDKFYPADVKLNCVAFGGYFLCNVDTVSQNVLNSMMKKGKTVINVKQGYTKCSVIPVGDNAIITDDEAISRKCREYSIDVLKIQKGNVILDGFDYGFIGGTAGELCNGIIAFNGDVFSHPDGEKIAEFIKKHNKTHLSLAEGELVDIGSLILLTED